MASTIPLTRRSSLLSTTRSTRSHPSPTVIQSLTKRLRSYKPVPHRSPLPFPPKRTIIHDDPPASSGFGPNPLAIPSTPPAQSSSSVASPSASRKGKARVSAPERRVLPARMRRAAGGGSEAVRDLEEMVFDWLERWGAPCTSPPDDLVMHITTLPLSLVHPPTFQMESARPAPSSVTVSPTRSRHHLVPSTAPRAVLASVEDKERIETPSWVFVKPGEDDKEEAKEELELSGRGPRMSPVKRLRKDEPTEDTSDAYYLALHKKYEVFERRQRIREKEKLVHERFKLRSRIDLLRNMSIPAWSAILAAVLSRGEAWTDGRAKLKDVGMDWLRHRLVSEGLEVMMRYDQLLPVEKKQKAIGSRNSTPSRASRSPELEDSPAPLVVNARVAALRDPASSSSRRVSTPSAPRSSSSGPYGELVRHGSAKKRQRETPYEGEGKETPSQPQRRRSSASARHVELPSNHHISHSHIPDSSMDPEESMRHHSRSSAPVTISGLPVLVEAASRRQSALAETDASREKVAAPRPGRLIAHEKTRSSSRLGLVAPFGMPLPPVVEYKSEFTLTDEEDFWPIIADRESRANQIRRSSLGLPSAVMLPVTKEEALEMEGVEAAVVL